MPHYGPTQDARGVVGRATIAREIRGLKSRFGDPEGGSIYSPKKSLHHVLIFPFVRHPNRS